MSGRDAATRRVPASTYRLQISSELPLQEAARLAGYLRDLGADWFYLSPLLEATPGSNHGYDVIDPRRIDPDRGGAEGLDAVSAAAREHGLGVLVDIVPNHMGVALPERNPWWWDLLQHGQDSQFAHCFDVDWEAGDGRLRIPVLGETIEAATASGALKVDAEAGQLRYYDHRYPLAPGTADDGASADVVHARQHYELMDWRRGDMDLNYRRFFAVSDLAAIRVELPEVFEASHAEVLRWVREGLIDGLRVDHPDGLADPGGYLDDLAEATGGLYVLVEKILEAGEPLPAFWATDGTTGYDALAELDRVLVDPDGEDALDALDTRLRGDARPWHELIRTTKRGIADGILQSEVRRLARDLRREAEVPFTDAELWDAIAEVLACVPVYRSYLPYGAEHLEEALWDAELRRPELVDVIEAVGERLRDPGTAVAQRFQQTSGMVMAKGVEDTAFYRVSRLTTLTEVGADPDEFAIEVDDFHARQQARLASLPASMTNLSTHDTKRGEDTRARITAISEVPADWAAFIGRRRAALSLGDGAFENLLWQAIVGSWPREREALHGYAEKASREGGVSTAWTAPDEAFEDRMHALVDSVFDDAETRADVEQTVELLRDAGYANGLALKLLQLTGPGVPDVYQGSELWERSLVDPDNRRHIDFAERARLLAAIDGGELPAIDETGAAKLLVTSRALRLRRDRPELFDRYMPVPAVGDAEDHVVAVDRGGAVAVATRLPIGLERVGGWGETAVLLPTGAYDDVLTGRRIAGGEVRLAELLDRYPVALLVRATDTDSTKDEEQN